MPQSVNKILKVLFDIKPVDQTGQVDLRKIHGVQPVVDLALVDSKKAPTDAASNKLVNSAGAAHSVSPVRHLAYSLSQPELKLQEKLISQDELEKYLNSDLNVRRELRNIGGKTVVRRKIGKPRYRPILSIKYPVLSIKERESETLNTEYLIPDTKYENFDERYETALKQINERIVPSNGKVLAGEPRRIDPVVEILNAYSKNKSKSHYGAGPFEWTSDVKASPEIESWTRYATSNARNFQFSIFPDGKAIEDPRQSRDNFQSIFKFRIPKLDLGFLKNPLKLPTFGLKYKSKSLLAYVLTGLLAFFVFNSFGQYGISVKNEVLKESNLAVVNLEQANDNLRVFDFEAASNNFAEAYEEFSKAGDSLNFMGASITSLFAELPGAGKLKSAKNLVEAGKLLAEAGKSMSEAVNSLSQTGAILNPNYELRITNYGFGDLKKSLATSGRNLSKANALLSEVSLEALPEDKRESFSEFQSKLPELEEIVSDAVEYTDFLESFLGVELATSDGRGTSDVRYLILFQNDSELRPTGGFPGTYAVVTFKDGRLADFLIDDVYNLDGQLKENIIPPSQLQHITPNWGMRDAGWFIDFSASAQKAMEFFKKEAGYEIDGVITMSPRMISDILKVVGPIEMPEYGYAINDENFISTIQAEVEYGDNREQPKQVVKDMAPRLLERIYSAEPGQWLEIFNVFISGLDKKDILMYFKDLNLESFAAEKGFGGLVKDTRTYADSTRTDTDMDYLMVTFNNVKGSKTDRVTDNSIKVSIRFEKGRMIHKLVLTRQHNGGSSRYGFYNRQNPAYVRVLVPEGSELLSISGNSEPGFKPLIGYSGTDFKQDDSLFKLESSFYFDGEKGVSTYKESGKTGFAFWLITDPGERKTVELEYAVPFDYAPSTQLGTSRGKPYDIYIQKQPGLEVDNFEFQVGEAYIYNGKFDKDLELRFKAE